MDEAAALQLKPEEVSSGILSIMEKCGIAPEGISDPRAKAELSKLLGEAAKFIYENADAETSASLERPVGKALPADTSPTADQPRRRPTVSQGSAPPSTRLTAGAAAKPRPGMLREALMPRSARSTH